MSSAPQLTPNLAFFGATGGVTNACLVQSLRAGYKCVALVRTPEKLRTQLLGQHITEDTLSSQLIITQGNATDKNAVTACLTAGGPGTLPSTIITGLGAAPKVGGWSLSNPLSFMTIDQPTICGDAAKTLVAAMTDIFAEQPNLKTSKPALVFVSTTGVTRGPEDVPAAMRTMYHSILKTPHEDKRAMENTYRENVDGPPEVKVFRSASGIRPTLLVGGVNADAGRGLWKVKAGTEMMPAMGYTVGRADVGHWMFEYLVKSGDAQRKWEGHMCSLTY